MKLSEALNGIGYSVSYYPGLRKLCGSVSATVLFCQLFYWKGKESNEDGWLYKDSSELEEETGLSYKEQATARKILIKKGLIEEKYDRLSHKMYFRVDVNSLNDQWEVPETPNGKFGKPPTVSSSITETTTENTYKDAKASFSEKPLKPTTPRGWANKRREELGKPPLKPRPLTAEQKAYLKRSRCIDYFHAKSIENGYDYLNEEDDQANRKYSALAKAFEKRYRDWETQKEAIDWFFASDDLAWTGYQPNHFFSVNIWMKFDNRNNNKSNFLSC